MAISKLVRNDIFNHRPLWVSMAAQMPRSASTADRIQVHCPTCHEVEAIISGWDETLWAEGPMEPVPMADD